MLFHVDLDAKEATFGFWLVPDARGRGAGSTAARMLAQWALTDGPFRRVDAIAAASNEASIRALERAGFVREGVRRSVVDPQQDGRQDVVGLAVVSEDVTPGG
jgi:RimJ/RimL family protein N-acetyltransferase